MAELTVTCECSTRLMTIRSSWLSGALRSTDIASSGPRDSRSALSSWPTVASVVVTCWVWPSCTTVTSFGVRTVMSVGLSGSRRERETEVKSRAE